MTQGSDGNIYLLGLAGAWAGGVPICLASGMMGNVTCSKTAAEGGAG